MISGKTGVVGIIADPIAHVRSPQAFNALMQARGRDVVMVPMRVTADQLGTFMASAATIRNLAGLVVTLPHKETILAYCTSLSSAAGRARAANVVRFHADGRIEGTNTDGSGFLAGLAGQDRPVAGQRVFLAGAGGAAKAIADALAGAGIAALGIYNRTRARADELVRHLRDAHPGLDVHVAPDCPRDYELAINATSLGLRPADPLPFSPDLLPRTAVVADVVMSADLTPLLSAAQVRGNPVHFGRHMLAGQVEEIARFLEVLGP